MLPSPAASGQNICRICWNSLRTEPGEAIFTAQCRHDFHLHCILNNPRHGRLCCPVCGMNWDEGSVPFPVPNPQPNHPGSFSFQFQPQPHWSPSPDPFGSIPQPRHPIVLLHQIHLSQYRSRDYPIVLLHQTHLAQYLSRDYPIGLHLAHSKNHCRSLRSVLATLMMNLSYVPQSLNPLDHSVTIRTNTETPAVSAAESCPQFPVLVSIRAPALQDPDGHGRTPIDLVAVLDVSGSMHGKKIELVKSAVKFVIQNLGASDRFSIVAFFSTCERLFPLKRMSVESRKSATVAVEALEADGTDIADGLNTGTRILEERRERNPVASIILLSDGQDNYCHTPSEMLKKLPSLIHSSDMKTEVPVHSFGFGNDHDANIMHAISEASGGTFSYIESVGMIQDSFALHWWSSQCCVSRTSPESKVSIKWGEECQYTIRETCQPDI